MTRSQPVRGNVVRPKRLGSALLLNALLLSVVPWPIYVDLSTWTMIWRDSVHSFDRLTENAIPMPIGAFAFVAFCLVSALKIRGMSLKTQRFTVSPVLAWAITSILVLLFALNALYSGSFTKFVQLYVILVALFGLRLPVVETDIRFLTVSVFFSFYVFLAIHVTSVFTSEHLRSDPNFAYGSFLDGSVHGSLVSYPPIVLLYGVVLLIKSLSARHQRVLLALGTVPVLFALLSDRREAMVQVIIFAGALTLVMVAFLVSRRNDRLLVRCIKLTAVVLPATAFFVQAAHVTSFERLLDSNQVDPRLEIWASAAPSDVLQLLFGNLQASNTAHNTVLSLLVSFGLLGLVPLILVSVGVVRFIRARARNVIAGGIRVRSTTVLVRHFLAWAFTVNIITSNLFNSNITQPYYVVNLIMLFMLVRTAR